MTKPFNRRSMMKLAAAAWLANVRRAGAAPAVETLFDGTTMGGWIQTENNATAFSAASFKDAPAFAAKIAKGNGVVSGLLRARLDAKLVAGLAAYDDKAADAKAVIAELVKQLNAVIGGPSLYQESTFAGVPLRPEAVQLVHEKPEGQALLRFNKILIEDAYPVELVQSITKGWAIKDGAVASTGVGRGVIYTAADYGRFRLRFSLRHVSGNPDHQPCVLIFCTRPKPGEKPLDALAGIQFQAPNGGHWDYRPGKNNAGADLFHALSPLKFNNQEWSRVEIVADASSGVARMAVAQPLDAKAVELVEFRDPTAGKSGPIALQMHNAGLFDEYRDITVERDPANMELTSAK